MIKIYTTNSCASCRKAIEWLKKNNIAYKEVNFFKQKLTREDIKYILKNTTNGFEDIISTRSKVFTDLNIDVEDLKFDELINLILENPSILKRPLIVNDVNIQVGYNDDDIRVFIPKELRSMALCDNCSSCEYDKEIKRTLKRII